MSKQQSRVTVRLREMILNGAFDAGAHIVETQLAKTLGVSRTPVRLALGELEHEGLVSGAPNRGFTVRSFSLEDISEAIDVRSTLEGMAARLAAEKGLSRQAELDLRDCLAEGDALLAKGYVEKSEAEDYQAMNVRLHTTIIEAADNMALTNAVTRNNRVPFAGAGAVAFQDARIMFQQFALGHDNHHTIVEALENRESARAEALMREHALIAKKSMNLLRLSGGDLEQADIPGLKLLRA